MARTLSIILLSITALAVSVSAQSQSVKYNNAGDLTWIGALLPDTTGCEPSKTFIGKVTAVRSDNGENSVAYELTLLTGSKKQKFQTSFSLDEGATIPDFENMIARGHRLKLKARQCGSGGFWTVEDVWRM